MQPLWKRCPIQVKPYDMVYIEGDWRTVIGKQNVMERGKLLAVTLHCVTYQSPGSGYSPSTAYTLSPYTNIDVR